MGTTDARKEPRIWVSRELSQPFSESLLEAHGAKVASALRKRFDGLLNEQDVEDVISQAIYQLLKLSERSSGDERVRVVTDGIDRLFMVLAYRSAVDLLRKRLPGKVQPLDHFDIPERTKVAGEEVTDDHRTPEVSSYLDAVREAFKDLPSVQQNILKAHIEASAGSSWQNDYASRHGMKTVTVRVNLHRALKTIRKRMEVQGYEFPIPLPSDLE